MVFFQKRHFFKVSKNANDREKWNRAKNVNLKENQRVRDLHSSEEHLREMDKFIIDGKGVFFDRHY